MVKYKTKIEKKWKSILIKTFLESIFAFCTYAIAMARFQIEKFFHAFQLVRTSLFGLRKQTCP